MLAMMMCSFLGLLPAAAAAAAAAAAPAGPYLTNPCLDSEKFKQAKFCDPTLGIDERAADIVSRLSIVEKIDALGTNTGASLCLLFCCCCCYCCVCALRIACRAPWSYHPFFKHVSLLGRDTPGALPSVGLGPYNWWSEATHGISHVRDGPKSTTPYETNFALPITTANSFNRSMWKATGRAIGTEARAFMNAGNAYSTYWAPVINLVRPKFLSTFR
jgi:hypothetical protein